jgi:RimJ/RimL family protein N-acetyltransferase
MEITLADDLVLLRPLAESDAEELWAATGQDPELWKWIWSIEPIPQSLAEMRKLIAAMLTRDAQGKRSTFAVVLKSSGKVIGSTSYLNRNEEEKSLEIGSTFYGKSARRTGVNTHCKYLLLTHAFEVLGCQRVLIKADSTNATSLAAIARIGAKREGVIRHDKQRRDGSWRDAIYSSVIAPEWPETKAHIEKLLSNYS